MKFIKTAVIVAMLAIGVCRASAQTNPIILVGSPAYQARWNAMLTDCRSIPAFEAMYQTILNQLTSNGKTITLILVDKDIGTIGDSFCTGRVDLTDLKLLPTYDPEWRTDTCGIILHILFERAAAATDTLGRPYKLASGEGHQKATIAEKILRCEMGYKTYVMDRTHAATGGNIRKICEIWKHKETGQKKTIYMPVPTEGQSAVATVVSSQNMGAGVIRYNLAIDTSSPRIDEMPLAYRFGGSVATFQNYSGTMTVESFPVSDVTNHLGIRVISMSCTAPTVSVPGFGNTGTSTISLDLAKTQLLSADEGMWNLTTGQLAFSYYGTVVNSLYPNGLELYGMATAVWDGVATSVPYNTMATLGDAKFHEVEPELKVLESEPDEPLRLRIVAPDHEGMNYEVRFSFELAYGALTNVNNSLAIALGNDALYIASSDNPDPLIFEDTFGTLNASGEAEMALNISAGHPLYKARIFALGLVLHPSAPDGVATITHELEIWR